MASGNANSGIVALSAIMLLAMLGSFIAWQAGVFGNGEHRGNKVDVNISQPRK